jgi:hypothetical protein
MREVSADQWLQICLQGLKSAKEEPDDISASKKLRVERVFRQVVTEVRHVRASFSLNPKDTRSHQCIFASWQERIQVLSDIRTQLSMLVHHDDRWVAIFSCLPSKVHLCS